MIKLRGLIFNLNEEIDAPASIQQNANSVKFSSDFINFIKQIENEGKVGYNRKLKLWFPHKSPEGGSPTIGYGHKLGKDLSRYKKGLTDKQVEDLLKYDLERANRIVHEYIKKRYKVSLRLSQKQEEMLTEFAFNLGGLEKFPKFVDAVLRNNWEVAKKEYERGYTDSNGKKKKLDRRNKAFYDRYFK